MGGDGEASTTSKKSMHKGFSHTSVPEAEKSMFYKACYKVLKSHTFEHVMGLVIAINFLVVVVETDHNAKDKDAPFWAWLTSWCLLVTFVVELILKLYVLRRSFWHESWNVFDFFVITIDVVMSILEVFNIDFVDVSMLRILRLSRLARAAKVLRVFPELHLMLAGLTGAVQAIFWGTVLLFFALVIWSVLAVQFIHPLNLKVDESSSVYVGCERCPKAYESTFQAALTFTTQIVAGDSWGRETVPIIEHYPPTALFFMGVFVSVGLAILNLILGVVVNVATEARDGLLREMADEKMLMRLEQHNSLLKMCQEMDDDGNDELCFEELKLGYETNEDFRHTLEAMDIGPEDLQIVWTILDSDRSGTVTSKEFVSQIYKLKASDTQFMLAYIKFYITEIKDKLRDDFKSLRDKMQINMDQVDKDMQKIDAEIRESAHIDQAPQLMEKCECGNVFMDDALFCRKCGSRRKDVCSCGNVFMDDSLFCRKCGKQRKASGVVQSSTSVGSTPVQDAQSSAKPQQPPAARPYVSGSSYPARNGIGGNIDTLFERGSLEDLLEQVKVSFLGGEISDSRGVSVNIADRGEADRRSGSPALNLLGGTLDESEILDQLEGMWDKCIASIDDMRGFHSKLANMLESMVRRLSLSIAQTVSASVKQTAQRARPFSLAYRITDKQLLPARSDTDQYDTLADYDSETQVLKEERTACSATETHI
jgi:hypothetical protein